MGPAHMPLDHLLPLRCFSHIQHAQAFLLVDRHGRFHPLVAPPLSQVSGAQDCAPKNSLVYPFHAVTKRPRHSRQRGLLRPPTLNASRHAYILLFTDCFSRRTDMYATTEAQFTASGTSDILVDRYIPRWRCPVTLLSDNGLQFFSKLSLALYDRLGINKISTSS